MCGSFRNWLRAGVIFVATASTLGLLSSCAPKDDESLPRAPVTEAYGMLDKGETSRAIELLERVVRKEPGHNEARLLLASAYMGKAGVDVLALHNSFSDVLFSKSLSDVFFKGDGGPKGDPIGGAGALPPPAGPAPAPAPEPSAGPAGKPGRVVLTQAQEATQVEALLQKIDVFLDNVRRVLVIFNRFPHVPVERWPLLDHALYHLDQMPPGLKQVRVYRMFIRLVYLKEVLVTRIIRDPSFATRQWACAMDLKVIDQAVSWMVGNVDAIIADCLVVFPDKAQPFGRIKTGLEAFAQATELLKNGTPAGGESLEMMGERRLKGALRCSEP